MKNRSSISCDEVQQRLLERDTRELDGPNKQHLESCSKCREFQQLLTNISKTTEAQAEGSLQPDPQTLKALKRKLETHTASVADNQTGSLIESLLALFQKRVPVYQVLMGVFVAAIFYFSFTETQLFEAKPKESKTISQSKENIQPIEFPVQTQWDQTNQMGKSLAEDSALAKFRVSIM